ncbi:DUF3768 domain-containing protein [Neorhizobium sp. S3-V5DH]|uniref:DUF3768 domain-containing protein n=1 Tax=Neorhizobium sp. S3-V5DH TaxID=2485166 RepID=UPI001053824A|nr:DUF3768 domain-containing protein [Neorhizobium sp. S3-V5DH]TCV75921.1 uncharacterized protein DUF3768 [Neorhizobium sp. S3-V5DH]
MTEATPSASHDVRRLNDALRKTLIGGRVLLTSGVQRLDEAQQAELLQAVRSFDTFTAANDPYGEHDFGRVVIADEGYFWKIDYYDTDLRYQSPDPADSTVTTRVLTIMREDEY